MSTEEYLDDIHIRILRVTEDLRVVQRELNCAAMQAPGDPELMEALSQLPEIESIQMLRSALDQMRHFLWFYVQIMTSDSEDADRIRQTMRQKPAEDVALRSASRLMDQFKQISEQAMVRFLAEARNRKPN